jgi:hypothetical protein
MTARAISLNSDQLQITDGGARTPTLPAGIVTTLRLEGCAACATAIFAYAHTGQSWLMFALLFLTPDLSMAAYFMGPRTGAAIYNLFHSYAGAATVWCSSLALGNQMATAVALVWFAHIGFDRALGYGLKFTTSFKHTHLGCIGR